MNKLLGALAALVFAATPAISYFKYARPLQPTTTTGQHYLVVDETIWQHAAPDLRDVRMYAGEDEIPYKLTVETGGSEIEEKQFRILQPASVAGKTQFLLDMSGVAEYDRIHLKLATKNFVARARIEGQDDPHGNHWALLGTTTLYDLSNEKLGSNSTLQIPLSAFKFLRVTADSVVKPGEVQSGTAGVTRALKAVWREVNGQAKQELQGKDTVFTFSVPANTPVERVLFDVDPAQKNFRREISVQDDRRQQFAAGEISRIHMVRNTQKVDVEQPTLNICSNCLAAPKQENFKIVIHNGDDAPVKITAAHLQQFERRMYFDVSAGVQPRLYYGDDKLHVPEYDYAKLFQKENGGDQVAMNAEEKNSAYTSRPDDRPWSERHPAVLWTTIIAAVLVLGAVALRSLRTSPTVV
jgi:hypothetical protein